MCKFHVYDGIIKYIYLVSILITIVEDVDKFIVINQFLTTIDDLHHEFKFLQEWIYLSTFPGVIMLV